MSEHARGNHFVRSILHLARFEWATLQRAVRVCVENEKTMQ